MPINVEEGWDFLQKAITKVKNILEGMPEPQFTSGESMLLYTTVYNMCMCNQIRPFQFLARPLYEKYKEAFEEYIISTVLPSLREKKDELLLREMLRRWSNHKIMTKWLSRFFLYLDKYPQWERPSLKETGYSSFYNLVYQEMNKQVLDAMLAMVDRKRAGEKIDRTLLLNALDFYLEFEEITRKNNAKDKISENLSEDQARVATKGVPSKINAYRDDAIGKLFGPEHGGRTHGFGLGVSPTDVSENRSHYTEFIQTGSSSQMNVENLKNKVVDLEEKLEGYEETKQQLTQTTEELTQTKEKLRQATNELTKVQRFLQHKFGDELSMFDL